MKNFCHTGVDKCVRGSAHEEFSQDFKGHRQGVEEEVVVVVEEEEVVVVEEEESSRYRTLKKSSMMAP